MLPSSCVRLAIGFCSRRVFEENGYVSAKYDSHAATFSCNSRQG